MTGRPAYSFARGGVARTFQVPRLFNRMTVMENLIVPALTDAAVSRKQAEKRGHEVLAFLRFEHLANAFARTLSGGQQKLLELGRAFMLRPSLLLLDEPFAGVHPKLLEQIIEHIRKLNADGYTIVLVDHNLDAVRSVVRRTLVMARGRKIADGASDEVLRDPAVIRAYTGTRKPARRRRRRLDRRRRSCRDGNRSKVRLKAHPCSRPMSWSSATRAKSTFCATCRARCGPADISCVVGPNGTGKSTLLKALFGFLKPHSGRVSPVRPGCDRHCALRHARPRGRLSAAAAKLVSAPHGRIESQTRALACTAAQGLGAQKARRGI